MISFTQNSETTSPIYSSYINSNTCMKFRDAMHSAMKQIHYIVAMLNLFCLFQNTLKFLLIGLGRRDNLSTLILWGFQLWA